MAMTESMAVTVLHRTQLTTQRGEPQRGEPQRGEPQRGEPEEPDAADEADSQAVSRYEKSGKRLD